MLYVDEKLSHVRDKTLRIGDILDYTEKAAELNQKCASDILKNIGHGESTVSALGGAAYFLEQERMYRYDIPRALLTVLNDTEQKEGETK